MREQLALPDAEERTPRCSTKDVSLFARGPYLNLLGMEVPFQQTLAPVVMSLAHAQSTTLPTVPEMMLTVRWNCPACNRPLSIMKRQPKISDDRISIPGPIHLTTNTEQCLADVWLVLESSEDETLEEELFSVQLWQLTHAQKLLGEVQEQ